MTSYSKRVIGIIAFLLFYIPLSQVSFGIEFNYSFYSLYHQREALYRSGDYILTSNGYESLLYNFTLNITLTGENIKEINISVPVLLTEAYNMSSEEYEAVKINTSFINYTISNNNWKCSFKYDDSESRVECHNKTVTETNDIWIAINLTFKTNYSTVDFLDFTDYNIFTINAADNQETYTDDYEFEIDNDYPYVYVDGIQTWYNLIGTPLYYVLDLTNTSYNPANKGIIFEASDDSLVNVAYYNTSEIVKENVSSDEFLKIIELPDGEYEVNISATDFYGRKLSYSNNISIESIPPTNVKIVNYSLENDPYIEVYAEDDSLPIYPVLVSFMKNSTAQLVPVVVGLGSIIDDTQNGTIHLFIGGYPELFIYRNESFIYLPKMMLFDDAGNYITTNINLPIDDLLKLQNNYIALFSSITDPYSYVFHYRGDNLITPERNLTFNLLVNMSTYNSTGSIKNIENVSLYYFIQPFGDYNFSRYVVPDDNNLTYIGSFSLINTNGDIYTYQINLSEFKVNCSSCFVKFMAEIEFTEDYGWFIEDFPGYTLLYINYSSYNLPELNTNKSPINVTISRGNVNLTFTNLNLNSDFAIALKHLTFNYLNTSSVIVPDYISTIINGTLSKLIYLKNANKANATITWSNITNNTEIKVIKVETNLLYNSSTSELMLSNYTVYDGNLIWDNESKTVTINVTGFSGYLLDYRKPECQIINFPTSVESGSQITAKVNCQDDTGIFYVEIANVGNMSLENESYTNGTWELTFTPSSGSYTIRACDFANNCIEMSRSVTVTSSSSGGSSEGSSGGSTGGSLGGSLGGTLGGISNETNESEVESNVSNENLSEEIVIENKTIKFEIENLSANGVEIKGKVNGTKNITVPDVSLNITINVNESANVTVKVAPIKKEVEVNGERKKVYLVIEVESEKEVSNAVFKFRVEKEWLKENGISSDEVVVIHVHEGKEEIINPEIIGEDNNYVYYQFEVSKFSQFLVTFKENEETNEGAKVTVTKESEKEVEVNESTNVTQEEVEEGEVNESRSTMGKISGGTYKSENIIVLAVAIMAVVSLITAILGVLKKFK